MSKVKSAIITAILVAAIIVAALFAVVSFPVAGSNGVKKIDSIASRINLGGEFTGEAYRIIYPAGVIPAAQYERGLPEVPEVGDDDYDDKLEEREEYLKKYVPCGNVYIESELVAELDEDGSVVTDTDVGGIGNGKLDEEKLKELKSAVCADAKILAGRFDKRDFLNCSISIVDNFAIRVSVPTGYNGAAYRGDDFSGSAGSSTAGTQISTAIQFLTLAGELTLRHNDSNLYQNDDGAGILTGIDEDVTTWFRDVRTFSRGGNYAIKLNLNDGGYSKFSKLVSDINDSDTYSEKTILFYVGENLLLSLNVESGVPDQKSFYIQVSTEEQAQNYATIFNSVINGEILNYDYNDDNSVSTSIIYVTAVLGEKAALLLGISVLIILLAAVAVPFIRYKKLAIVNALSVLGFALVMVYAIFLLNITLTFAGVITALLGLALLEFSNIRAFEAVREETTKGKTMQASVKSGYRAILSSMLDMHILLLLASIILALVPVGEAAACGFIFFVATLASYAFYWITRFMWYVISSPVRDKFKFGGYRREVLDDD